MLVHTGRGQMVMQMFSADVADGHINWINCIIADD